MAAECVTVKQEPADLPDEAENESQLAPPNDQNGPEFVNIKMELDVPVLNESIKSELVDNVPVKKGKSEDSSWEVPLQEVDSILPDCLEVSVKVEPEDDYNHTTDEEPCSSQVALNGGQDNFNQQHNGYVCRICFKQFANQGNVQRHMLLHSKQKLNCTECPKQFLSQEQLDKHMHRHTLKETERAYVCDCCDKRFKSSSNLMQHKRVHLTVKPYFCSQCHRSFAFKANLTKHQGKSRCKRPIDEPIQCHVCHKVFEKEFLLKSHLRRHDTDRPFSCDQCSMNFKYKSTLIRHIQLHNGVRPYSCPVCDKTFTHSGLLKPHMRVHTGEKPYQCPVCSKSFAHKHNMQRHATRHNKIKHLVCDICHKQFPKESRLKYHMKTHVNEKHFSCEVCPKKFSHKQNVLRHYARKHPNAKYVCKDTDASVALRVWDTIKSKYSDDPGQILG